MFLTWTLADINVESKTYLIHKKEQSEETKEQKQCRKRKIIKGSPKPANNIN